MNGVIEEGGDHEPCDNDEGFHTLRYRVVHRDTSWLAQRTPLRSCSHRLSSRDLIMSCPSLNYGGNIPSYRLRYPVLEQRQRHAAS